MSFHVELGTPWNWIGIRVSVANMTAFQFVVLREYKQPFLLIVLNRIWIEPRKEKSA